MWSFGCVAAELYLRRPLIAPAATAAATAAQAPSGKTFVDAIAAIVGRPGQEAVVDAMPACAASWLDELPFFKKWYGQSGQAWLTASAETAKAWPPPCLEGCPEGLVRLVQKRLAWYPSARMNIAGAKNPQLPAAAWPGAAACPPGHAARQEWRRNDSGGRPRPRFAPLFADVPQLEQPGREALEDGINHVQMRPMGTRRHWASKQRSQASWMKKTPRSAAP